MTIPPAPDFFTGCLWPVDSSCVTAEWEALEPPEQLRALALASSALESLVAHRVTACPLTVRPCHSPCGCSRPSCGSCRASCELDLGYVGQILDVSVDGEQIPLEQFRIDDHSTIVYEGPDDCPFLAPQDLSKGLGEQGTWSVTYLPGAPVDTQGAMAVTLLALEFSKACAGDDCDLPAGVRTIVRFGATYDIQAGAFPDGFTGIRFVDDFIELWNPQGRRQQSGVYSPDMPELRFVQ